MKWQVILIGIFLVLSATTVIAGATGAQEPMGLRVKKFSNATYPDGNSVNNLTMIYDPSMNNPYILFWDEAEEYTYNSHSYKTHEIMISASSDFVNWSGSKEDKVISMEDGTNSSSPDAAVNPRNGEIFLVWSEMNKTSEYSEIYLGRSSDGGNWTSTVKNLIISNYMDPMVGNCSRPAITVTNDGYIHAVWLGYNYTTKSTEVYYGNSASGDAWTSQSKDVAISTEDPNNATSVDIISMNDTASRVWVFWTEYEISDSAYVVYAANSSYPYTKWNTSMIGSEVGYSAYNVTATVYNGEIYVFWEQEVDESGKLVREVAGKYFNGSGWNNAAGNGYIVSFEDGRDALHPRASVGAPGVFVVWDEFDENHNCREIMISNTTGNGEWSGTKGDILITSDASSNKEPQVYVSDAGQIYIAWLHWTEEETKQRGSWDGCTLSANVGEVIPEMLIIYAIPAIAVLVYASGKRKRN